MVVVGSECSAGTVCGLHSMPGKVGIFIYNRWDVGSDGRGRGAAIKKKILVCTLRGDCSWQSGFNS